jgi:hypothetical protein
MAAASGTYTGEPKRRGGDENLTGGGNPECVPLAAAGHGAWRDAATASVIAHETPGVPPQIALAAP